MEGFVKVGAITPTIRVADCEYNKESIFDCVRIADEAGIQLLCLPEMCLTGYTCGELYLQDSLIEDARNALLWLANKSLITPKVIFVVGTPLKYNGKLYNTGVVIHCGKILGIVPKTHMPTYGEFYDLRYFQSAPESVEKINIPGHGHINIPFGTDILFQCYQDENFTFAIELCEDIWVPNPPSTRHAMAGANIILNLSASDETMGKAEYRKLLVSGQSGKLICGYAYASAGVGESTSDMVFAAHNIIAENGQILAESEPFGKGKAYTDIDTAALAHDRRKQNSFTLNGAGYHVAKFVDTWRQHEHEYKLTRKIDKYPYLSGGQIKQEICCRRVFEIQAHGLASRIASRGSKLIIGMSGGGDSALALMVCIRALDILGRPLTDIIAYTMPCFGTTSQTLSSAHEVCKALGITLIEKDITKTVQSHFNDLEHDESNEDIVFENVQARVRTLLLMNAANQHGGFVVGTGTMSEMALGWATYNGDHMSMYNPNSGIFKTLARHVLAVKAKDMGVSKEINKILNRPISPELTAHKDGEIQQVTENIVGPYELHDFFLFHMTRFGRKPRVILNLAKEAFGDDYSAYEIKCWLEVFYKRFFAAQFKRNCVPDGVKIGSVSLSPRSDWRMPSDAVVTGWLADLERME